jgi:hypothetical protein
VADPDSKSATGTSNAARTGGVPGSASSAHPTAAIPLPAHGFDTLDDISVRDLAAIPAEQVIIRAAVMLISSAAEKLGLSAEGEPQLDLVEARELITALAGLIAATRNYLGEQREPLLDGLKTLQNAFREASAHPDAPGHGPGEALIA